MKEIRFKIYETQSAKVEIIPVADGVEIVVRYGENNATKDYKFNKKTKTPEDIIEDMKAAAREEYKNKDSDKKELKKFVEFYERKINEDGWRGEFKFKELYKRWLENKR